MQDGMGCLPIRAEPFWAGGTSSFAAAQLQLKAPLECRNTQPRSNSKLDYGRREGDRGFESGCQSSVAYACTRESGVAFAREWIVWESESR